MASALQPRNAAFRAQLDPLMTSYALSAARPISQMTEFSYSDDEDGSDDAGSLLEEDSLRYHYSSDARRSQSTISSFDEVQTPRSGHRGDDYVQIFRPSSIQGPKGPHLFRASDDFSNADFANLQILQLSPIETKDLKALPLSRPQPTRYTSDSAVPRKLPALNTQNIKQPQAEPTSAIVILDESKVRSWTAQNVADWLFNQGFEESICEKFDVNDVDGSILLGMKFEDLKELGIPSFGRRHQLWNELAALKAACSFTPVAEKAPELPRAPSQPTTQSHASLQRSMSVRDARRPNRQDLPKLGVPRRGRFSMQDAYDVISPAESISITALQQLFPSPETSGNNQQRQYLAPAISATHNADFDRTASFASEATDIVVDTPETPTAPDFRPTSEAVNSMVASSDVMGGQLPPFALLEGALSAAGKADPQDSVQQFLNLQRIESQRYTPPSPVEQAPLEMFPALQQRSVASSSNSSRQFLSKLSIPPSPSADNFALSPSQNEAARGITASPLRMAMSPPSFDRHGTPASEMDVPLTSYVLEPLARNASQSVPPNMQYREQNMQFAPPRRVQSYEPQNFSRRPPFALSPVIEASPREARSNAATSINAYLSRQQAATKATYGESATHAGWMRKRKTKLLRHEWTEAHFRLHGTRLAMHSSEHPADTLPLDTIDVDHYGIVCSSLPQNSKVTAALKSLKLKSDGPRPGRRSSMDDAAFAFQLVPHTLNAPASPPRRERGNSFSGHTSNRLIKDQSTTAGAKTHTFAVRSRDERIDWMREVMLAKAVRQKAAGFEVTVNGNVV